ncbi:hypothetical protein B0H13DRAFT_1906729 [Mycena leptocephala]|nr:hypothetical protein B0H13DRAFT_1906729 [Mycena leptocephala]
MDAEVAMSGLVRVSSSNSHFSKANEGDAHCTNPDSADTKLRNSRVIMSARENRVGQSHFPALPLGRRPVNSTETPYRQNLNEEYYTGKFHLNLKVTQHEASKATCPEGPLHPMHRCGSSCSWASVSKQGEVGAGREAEGRATARSRKEDQGRHGSKEKDGEAEVGSREGGRWKGGGRRIVERDAEEGQRESRTERDGDKGRYKQGESWAEYHERRTRAKPSRWRRRRWS